MLIRRLLTSAVSFVLGVAGGYAASKAWIEAP
jgi:hypothetical protein